MLVFSNALYIQAKQGTAKIHPKYKDLLGAETDSKLHFVVRSRVHHLLFISQLSPTLVPVGPEQNAVRLCLSRRAFIL